MSAQAFIGSFMVPGAYIPQIYYKHGAVYTRAMVLGPNGRPVYVEYNSEGREAREIGEAIGQFERAQLMSGSTYRALLQRLTDVRERHPDSRIMSAAEYRSTAFTTAGGDSIQKPMIASGSLTVVVRPPAQLFDRAGGDLLLLELPIKHDVTPDTTSVSLLLSPEGNILHQSANSIAFRVGFFGKDGTVSEGLQRARDADIYGPVPGSVVTLGGVYLGGAAVTGDDGRYNMTYFLPPCPGFTFEYSTPAYLELQYRRFNPRGSAYMPYYMVRQDWDFCNGLGVYSLAAMAIVASTATPMKPMFDFPVDLMVLDGSAKLQNVQVAQETVYNAQTSEHRRHIQDAYDFDGDEKPDFVVPGKKVTQTIEGEQKQVFVQTTLEEAELQGIYLSSRHEGVPTDTTDTEPDFTRLIDTAPDFQDRGLLESISTEDLRDTDIYVFRESTGQLVAERRGLHEDELYKTYSGVDESQGSFRYTIQLRGSVENTFAISGRTGEENFARWQSAGGFKEEFQRRTANHLKAGEQVRIIAINRPTGYMGSTRIQLQSALSGNMINLNSQRIELTPPNLKVWAERKSRTEYGMTRGEEKRQLIGSEGAGLGSDVSIAIYTDWRDSDGSPLPEELADYGYTGRLAKIVAANQLAPVGANNLSQFQIKPGQQVQVIHLPERVLAKQHLYLQVAGQPENRNPDFSSNGQAAGILKYRPTRYVPIKVPLHDEEASELARQAYRKAEKSNPDADLKKPEPVYGWSYRPELQFSLYDLNVREILASDVSNAVQDILKDAVPSVSGSDRYVQILYDLLKNSVDQLGTWSYTGDRTMVFALGEEEVRATIGSGQNITFENIAHLTQLDADDFLSLRLYANNDTGNTLFEYAFEYFSIDSVLIGYNHQTDDTWYVTADDPQVELQAALAGYSNRSQSIKKPLTVTWQVDGAGSLESRLQRDQDLGIFPNVLTMPRRAGSSAVVNATLHESDIRTQFKRVEVLPGKPAQVQIKTSGAAAAMDSDTLEVEVTVRDAHGNFVEDGTSVSFAVNQSASIQEYTPGTENGIATAKLTGDAFASESAQLTVTVDSIVQTHAFEIEGLDIQLQAANDSFVANREQTIKARVTTRSGKPAANVLVTVSSTLGYVAESQYETNANGELSVVFHSGPIAGEGVIKFRAGFAGTAEHAFNIKHLGEQVQADVRDVMVLGDVQAGQAVTYERYDGTRINLDYQTQGELRIRGTAGSRVAVELGDLADPNLEPLLAYYMNDLEDIGPDTDYPGRIVSDVPDETGLYTGTAFDVQVVRDHPMGRGKSYLFDEDAYVDLAMPDTLLRSGDLGFRIDLRAFSDGQVMDLAGGQRLTLSQGRLSYVLQTEDGQFSVSAPVTLNQWHSVGGRYANGLLELEVDGVRFSTAASGQVEYSGNTLALGKTFTGRLNSFRLYDWSAQPLLVLAGGQNSVQLELDGSGVAGLTVQSTGQLGTLQADAAMKMLRVAVRVDGVRQFVSVLSTEGYVALAGQYLTTYSSAAPPVNVAGLEHRLQPWYAGITVAPLQYLVPVAYADEESSAWGFIKGAVNFLFPLEDFAILGEQLYYLATGDFEQFDAMELTFAALSVSTVIPVMKPLKLVMDPLRRFVRRYGKNPIVGALAGVLGRATEEAVKGRTEKLVSLLPYFLIVVEMLESPEGPVAIAAMVEAIESPDDLWAWIEYLNLPADGWEGDDMPSVAGAPVSFKEKDLISSTVGFFVGSAEAAKIRNTTRRRQGKEFAEDLTDTLQLADPKHITLFFKEVVAVLKSPGAGSARKMAHMKPLLLSGVALVKRRGPHELRGLIVGSPDDRVPRAAVIAAVAFIESSIANGELESVSHLKIASLYADAFLPTKDINRHGGTFQLMMLAYYHALYRFADGESVLDIEVTYTSPNPRMIKKRRVDIVLGTPAKQTWVEVKSLKWRYNNSAFAPRGIYHTEHYSDLLYKSNLNELLSVDYKWRFLDFKTKDNTAQGPSRAQFDNYKVESRLCAPVNGTLPGSNVLLGKDPKTLQRECLSNDFAEMQNAQAMLREIIKIPDFAVLVNIINEG